MTEIHKALNAAMREICAKGIAKLSRADTGGARFNFRGIEAAMNEMSPILVNHGITVTAAYSDLSITERAKAEAGKATRFVTIKGTFTFAAQDGSNVCSEVYGEAMDSGDKAVVKAQSIAFRTALFQQFVVPTMSMDPELTSGDGDEEPGELDEAQEAALGGSVALQRWWEGQTKEVRQKLAKALPGLKKAAATADTETRQ